MSAPPELRVGRVNEDDVALIKASNFITRPERIILLEWANQMLPFLNNNGKSRRFCRINRLPRKALCYDAVQSRVERLLGVENYSEEPVLGSYLSVIGDGGAVHLHKDAVEPGFRHLRCNLFIQIPEKGGFPIVESTRIFIQERELIVFYPNEQAHSSELVCGSRDRIICSFGYRVPKTFTLRRSPLCQQPIVQ